jgi:two-component system chemotaxis response regulator CheY
MANVIILCIEDERDVLDALTRDLRPFEPTFRVEATQSVDEARRVVQAVEAAGDRVGLVLADHILPGATGVDFLVELHNRPATVGARKVLVTAQAGHQDTIHAVNAAGLDHYIAKPWTRDDLHAVVRRQLTDYVIGHLPDLLPYMKVLDSQRLLNAMRNRPWAPD